MKKTLLSFLFLLFAIYAQAQNYKCLQPGVQPYFINGNNYLRAMRIDSVVASGSDTIYYPYRTQRYTSPGIDTVGSWLGGKVIQSANGNFLFDNVGGDSISIKTEANPGDSWLFYSDTTTETYVATVISMDTMTVLGVLDSIKTIVVNAYRGGVIDTLAYVNNYQMILSKNHGFVQIFDLYTFPYLHFDSSLGYAAMTDIYTNCICSGPYPGTPYWSPPYSYKIYLTFNRVPILKPTKLEMYNFNVGDMFASHYNTRADCTYDHGNDYTRYDSIIGKTIIDSFHINYAIDHALSGTSTYYYPGGIASTPISGDYIDTLYTDTSLVTLSNMPEEYSDPFHIYYYYPADTTFCYSSPLYIAMGLNPGFFDYCGFEAAFKQGFLPLIDTPLCYNAPACSGSGVMGFTDFVTDTMFYALKDGSSCGSVILPPLAVNSPMFANTAITIFPNPVQNELNISASDKIQKIVVLDILGQTLFTGGDYNANKVSVDVSRFPAGVYFIKINNTEVRKFVKE